MKSVTRTVARRSLLVAVGLLASCAGGPQQSVPSLAITTGTLPNGITGTPYLQTVQATGGVSPFAWTMTAGALPHNLSLSASTTNTVTISGTPDTGAQRVTFSLTAADSAGQSATQSYTVSILLGADDLTVAPSNLDFGVQLIRTSSVVLTETLTNTSSSPLAVNAIGMTGPNASDFNQRRSTCGLSLGAGAGCDVDLSFTPSQLGPRTAALTITDDNVGSPQSVAVNGIGVTSGPNATLSAYSLTFGSQTVNTTSSPQSITLNNYGTSTLDVATITVTANFGETDDCTGNLSSGTGCTINVTFTPNETGSINGALSVTDNASGSPHDVLLSGIGSSSGQCVPKEGQCYQGHSCCSGLKCVAIGDRDKCE